MPLVAVVCVAAWAGSMVTGAGRLARSALPLNTSVQSKSCHPERSTVADEVFWISTYSSNCDAAVRRRSLEMTTPEGDAADAEAAPISDDSSTTTSGTR